MKSNNSYFIFEPRGRTRTLQRSSRGSSKAIFLMSSGEHEEESIVLKILELAYGHQDHSSSAILQLVRLRVELHRQEIQQNVMSSHLLLIIYFI